MPKTPKLSRFKIQKRAPRPPALASSDNMGELYRQAYDLMARLYDIPANLPRDDMGLVENKMENWSQELDSILTFIYASPTHSLEELRAKIALSLSVLQNTQSDTETLLIYKQQTLKWIDEYAKS